MKKIRIGIFGSGSRGRSIARTFMMLGCEIVAICENRECARKESVEMLGNEVTVYENFSDFIEHDMDAVVLTNYFHEHAPYAIKCFERGLHVYSECISNGTMAEGVELVRAFEKSNSVYMLAENYPQMLFNREIKRICDSGTLGKILYAEGEYNHPGDPTDVKFKKMYNYYPEHWRNFLPRSYYITHSLGPVMWATGATPKRVTSFAAHAPMEGDVPVACHVADKASIITIQNDDGSIFRVTGCAAFGGHHNAYRVCGTKGTIENLRGMNGQVMLRYNDWEKPEGADEIKLYTPDWNDKDEDLIKQSGHGGGDYLTARMFVQCINENRQPEHPFNVYSAVAMSSVAILSHRSMLEGGVPYDIPDFRVAEDCAKYENDRLSPFYLSDGTAPTLPCSSVTDYAPTAKQLELYNKVISEF